MLPWGSFAPFRSLCWATPGSQASIRSVRLSTLRRCAFASGGPSATGSMRHIQLRREGQTITEFDIYDLIEKGRQIPRCSAAPRRCDLYSSDWTADCHQRRCERTRHLRTERRDDSRSRPRKCAGGMTSLADAGAGRRLSGLRTTPAARLKSFRWTLRDKHACSRMETCCGSFRFPRSLPMQ